MLILNKVEIFDILIENLNQDNLKINFLKLIFNFIRDLRGECY